MRPGFLYIGFWFLSLLTISSCTSQHSLKSHPAIDFAVAQIWQSDTCATGNKAQLVDLLLESPLSEMDTCLAHQWFGQPVHKRLFKNRSFAYVYYYSGSPDNDFCGFGDLFCIEFDSKAKLKTNYIYFITEDEEATFFWYAENLPSVSIEGENDNRFFRSMPRLSR